MADIADGHEKTERHGHALKREAAPSAFYNENDENNPFGNLIDDRVYLSMWF